MCLINTPEVCQETLFDILNWFVKIKNSINDGLTGELPNHKKLKWQVVITKFLLVSPSLQYNKYLKKKKKHFGVSCVSDLVKHGYKTK